MTGDQVANIFCFALLAGIVIWREIYHAHRETEMLDRLMAKNLGEYAQVEAYRNRKPEIVREQTAEIQDDYAATQADKANAMFIR